MNYFELHIGDYQRKTAHLSLAEHGAYSLMLQTFYATERPLPADRKVLYRLLRADSAAERKAVDSIAAQFWQPANTGLTNKRAEEVLANYRQWLDQQKANGKRGGRPQKTRGLSEPKPDENPSVLETITQSEPDGVPMGGDRARVPLPTSHLDHDLDTHTHTPESESEAEKGSVCGTFTKIGGEGNHRNGPQGPIPSVDEVMDELRREHRRAGK